MGQRLELNPPQRGKGASLLSTTPDCKALGGATMGFMQIRAFLWLPWEARVLCVVVQLHGCNARCRRLADVAHILGVPSLSAQSIRQAQFSTAHVRQRSLFLCLDFSRCMLGWLSLSHIGGIYAGRTMGLFKLGGS